MYKYSSSPRAHEELEREASRHFWAGDFNKALAVYDAIVEKTMLEGAGESREAAALAAELRGGGHHRGNGARGSAANILKSVLLR